MNNMQNPNPYMGNQFGSNGGPIQPTPPYVPQQTNNQRSSLFQSPNIPNSQTTSVFGKYVNDIQEITENDIPIDGSMAIFPKSDGSCIYTVRKSWDNNGSFRTSMYVPYVEPQQQLSQPVNNDMSQTILAELQSIKKMLKKPYYNNRNKQKHQEVAGNE